MIAPKNRARKGWFLIGKREMLREYFNVANEVGVLLSNWLFVVVSMVQLLQRSLVFVRYDYG